MMSTMLFALLISTTTTEGCAEVVPVPAEALSKGKHGEAFAAERDVEGHN